MDLLDICTGLMVNSTVIGKCGHSFHMVEISRLLLAVPNIDKLAALSSYLDSARLIKGVVPNVQAK